MCWKERNSKKGSDRRREINLQRCIATDYWTFSCILPLCGFRYLVYSIETCCISPPATSAWVTSSLENHWGNTVGPESMWVEFFVVLLFGREVRQEKWTPICSLGSGFRLVWMMACRRQSLFLHFIHGLFSNMCFHCFGAFLFVCFVLYRIYFLFYQRKIASNHFQAAFTLGENNFQRVNCPDWAKKQYNGTSASYSAPSAYLSIANYIYKLWIAWDQSSDWNVFTENIWMILNSTLIQSRKLHLLLTRAQKWSWPNNFPCLFLMSFCKNENQRFFL